ncbi:hypothetical protein Hanom_Chr15g01382541 [Helianthus anomalus]
MRIIRPCGVGIVPHRRRTSRSVAHWPPPSDASLASICEWWRRGHSLADVPTPLGSP